MCLEKNPFPVVQGGLQEVAKLTGVHSPVSSLCCRPSLRLGSRRPLLLTSVSLIRALSLFSPSCWGGVPGHPLFRQPAFQAAGSPGARTRARQQAWHSRGSTVRSVSAVRAPSNNPCQASQHRRLRRAVCHLSRDLSRVRPSLRQSGVRNLASS